MSSTYRITAVRVETTADDPHEHIARVRIGFDTSADMSREFARRTANSLGPFGNESFYHFGRVHRLRCLGAEPFDNGVRSPGWRN